MSELSDPETLALQLRAELVKAEEAVHDATTPEAKMEYNAPIWISLALSPLLPTCAALRRQRISRGQSQSGKVPGAGRELGNGDTGAG